MLDDDDSSYADFGSLAQSVSGMQAENYASIAAFQAEQAAARRAATEAAGSAYEAAVKSSDAGFALDSAVADVGYWSGQHQEDAEYLQAAEADYLSYMNSIESAEKEFADEQCRLLGLLQDSVDTGYNTVSSGTSSLDVQVCFVAGTKIRLKNGEVKTIEELKKGLFSRAAKHDDPAGEIGDFEIVELYENETDRLVEIEFENQTTGKRFTTKSTPEHPFFVYGKDWIAAEKIRVGDECRSASDQRISVVSVRLLEETCKVYNFQVKDAHTYFVGETDDESVLVHNDCNGLCKEGKYCGSYWHGLGQVGLGLGDSVIAIPVGIWSIVRHPIKTAQGVGTAILHPIKTAYTVAESMYDQAGSLRGQGAFLGDGLMTAAGGAGAIKKATETVKVIKKANKVDDVINVATKLDDSPLIPPPHQVIQNPGKIMGNPRNQLVDTGIPRQNGGWQQRWIRITDEDHASYRQACADELRRLHQESAKLELYDEAARQYHLEKMSVFRKSWLENFYNRRDY